MLADLPPEIIQHIAANLPTLNALVSLARTCRRLYKILADDRVYRTFIRNRFPNVETPPFWKDAAKALTARSRALDRCGVIGRFVVPSQDARVIGVAQSTRRDRPTLGHRPSIDSFECWTGDRWEDRKEVLAWGAGAEIIIRLRSTGKNAKQQCLKFNDLEDYSSRDDICGVHVLRPEHQSKQDDKLHIIYGRFNGSVDHIAISPEDGSYEHRQSFNTYWRDTSRLDLSSGPEPILSAQSSSGIWLYRTTTDDFEVQPFANLETVVTAEGASPYHSKFLSPNRIAVGVSGRSNYLAIADIANERISTVRNMLFDDGTRRIPGLDFIAPLNSQIPGHGAPGELFLSGWRMSQVRLVDTRSPRPYEQEYLDNTDFNSVYCIQPLGHCFLVGTGGNALIKVFDLRMPSSYNYLDAKPSVSLNRGYFSPSIQKLTAEANGVSPNGRLPRADYNCFLSHEVHTTGQRRRRNNRWTPRRYTGPIYTMSSPSATSATVYAGIVGGVVRVDFACTDDLTGIDGAWYRDRFGLDKSSSYDEADQRILQLAGYERPLPNDETSPVILRNQAALEEVTENDIRREMATGVDRRWRRSNEDSKDKRW
ncbi:hypothetical protein VTN49DRAFT_4699 [Thermomyces lanuginosus]|uniref:uncharacterized protein n=1 Tax=Thermomyces lanuginosus TaxID=5541 RepID=UPI003742A0D8